MITLRELEWVAGFLDGEGCFQRSKTCLAVTASQKDDWPLIRLRGILGGTIRHYEGYGRWAIHGAKAAAIMMTLHSLLSPRRQERIAGLLSWWRSLGLRGSFHRNLTHCKRGHEFTPENIYKKAAGKHRECRTCRTERERHQLTA